MSSTNASEQSGLGCSLEQLIHLIFNGHHDHIGSAGGIEVIHTPGHCAGQIALLWRPGRMQFVGHVASNMMGLGDPIGFENLEEGRARQRKLGSLSFDAAGFGQGKPIAHAASTRFRQKWGI